MERIASLAKTHPSHPLLLQTYRSLQKDQFHQFQNDEFQKRLHFLFQNKQLLVFPLWEQISTLLDHSSIPSELFSFYEKEWNHALELTLHHFSSSLSSISFDPFILQYYEFLFKIQYCIQLLDNKIWKSNSMFSILDSISSSTVNTDSSTLIFLLCQHQLSLCIPISITSTLQLYQIMDCMIQNEQSNFHLLRSNYEINKEEFKQRIRCKVICNQAKQMYDTWQKERNFFFNWMHQIQTHWKRMEKQLQHSIRIFFLYSIHCSTVLQKRMLLGLCKKCITSYQWISMLRIQSKLFEKEIATNQWYCTQNTKQILKKVLPFPLFEWMNQKPKRLVHSVLKSISLRLDETETIESVEDISLQLNLLIHQMNALNIFFELLQLSKSNIVNRIGDQLEHSNVMDSSVPLQVPLYEIMLRIGMEQYPLQNTTECSLEFEKWKQEIMETYQQRKSEEKEIWIAKQWKQHTMHQFFEKQSSHWNVESLFVETQEQTIQLSISYLQGLKNQIQQFLYQLLEMILKEESYNIHHLGQEFITQMRKISGIENYFTELDEKFLQKLNGCLQQLRQKSITWMKKEWKRKKHQFLYSTQQPSTAPQPMETKIEQYQFALQQAKQKIHQQLQQYTWKPLDTTIYFQLNSFDELIETVRQWCINSSSTILFLKHLFPDLDPRLQEWIQQCSEYLTQQWQFQTHSIPFLSFYDQLLQYNQKFIIPTNHTI